MTEYAYKSGARIKAPAQVAGEMCEELSRTGSLTPKRLLDANRSEGTPLHNEFEWDDWVAAEAYRVGQAGHIIRCIVTVPKTPEKESTAPVRAFVRVVEETSNYTPIQVVVQHPDQMEILLSQAKKELDAFVKKYAALNELKDVMEVIEKFLDECA